MSKWTEATCIANGIHLHYLRTGGSKPPLILLHGLMTSGPCWTGLARSLENEYDVIMPDARGHGQSDTPALGYSYFDHADDVMGLGRVLNLSSYILLGHSMGGMTAAVVASRKPAPLRSLILADPPFLDPGIQIEVWESEVREQHRKLLDMPIGEVIADAKARHPGRSQETIELLSRARHQTSLAAFEVLRPPAPDYEELIREIRVPSLLVLGERGVVSEKMARDLQLINSNLQTTLIPNTGHSLHLDQPEAFASLVNFFLKTIQKN
ncbi:MAG: alpha/beta hydrolase [Bacteroidota bacterium]|nr:alpha/beta hydrolase [Bacteroidota bacterium]